MSNDRLLQILGRHPFTDSFNRREEELLADIAEEVEFTPGQYLLEEDRPCRKFFLLIDGQVSIELRLQGSRLLRLETQGAGTVVGWSWLFEPYLAAFDVRAVEKTRAIEIDAAAMRSLIDEQPIFGCKALKVILGVVAHRLGQSRLQLVDIHSAGES